MPSKFLVPFELPDYQGVPVSTADPGFVLAYIKHGWWTKHTGIEETDLVLQRPLDGFTEVDRYANPVTASDTVLGAIEKIQRSLSTLKLVGDVTGTATYAGGELVIQTTGGGAGIDCTDLLNCQVIIDLQGDVATLQTDVTSINLNIDIILADVINLQGNFSVLESAVTILQNDVAALYGVTVTLDSRVTDLENAGFLTSFTETDPIFTASAAAAISSTDITNWNTAYGWGDHSTAGYITAEADTLDNVTTRGNTTLNTITVGGITATGITSTIYAGASTRLRTEANNLVFERMASSGFMKIYINQTTLSATAKAYMGYNNATLNAIFSNEHSSGNLELRTQDIIRQQIFANGNVVIGSSAPTDAGYRLDVQGTSRFTSSAVFNSSMTIGGAVAASSSLAVGTNAPAVASAQVEIVSTTRGFLPPRMTTVEKDAIATPAAGLVVYDSTDNKHYGYDGSAWYSFYAPMLGLQDVINNNASLSQINNIDVAEYDFFWDNVGKYSFYSKKFVDINVDNGVQQARIMASVFGGGDAYVTMIASGASGQTGIDVMPTGIYIKTLNYSAASAGDVLTLVDPASGEVEFQAASGGSGGGSGGGGSSQTLLEKAALGYEYYNDFLSTPTTSTSSDGSGYIFFFSGTSASVVSLTAPGIRANNQHGFIRPTTGTLANGYAGLYGGGAGNQFLLGGGAMTFTTSVLFNTFSTSTERYRVTIGYGDQATSAADVNGIFFTYDEGGTANGTTASPNWQCVTTAGSVRTLTTTTVAINNTAWCKLSIQINAAGTSVAFYINNTLVATHTTNIPSGAAQLVTPRVNISKTIGLISRFFHMDYIYYAQTYTTTKPV